ncbi:fibronectin type III domain-containing protein [Candidatus Poriferisodalis sp.]|uniref:fibronectin type III domain-containing protein n=1 Tax=Candidatus Poriferisodalis sp. TaxID=3101277 RepID=UPI003AF8E7AE
MPYPPPPSHGPPPDRSSRLGGSWRVLAACAAAALFAAILFLPSSASATNSASKPTGLAAALVDADSGDEYDGVVTLTWNAPARDASSVTGYQVLRRQPGVDAVGVFHTLVDNTSTTDTSYEDFSANDPGAAYTYRVKAWRDTALSGRSRWTRIDLPASYTPPPPDTTPPPPDTVPPDTVPPVAGASSVTTAKVEGGDDGQSDETLIDKTLIPDTSEVVARDVVVAPDNPVPARADLNPCSLAKHSSKYWCRRSAFRKYLAPIDLRMTYTDQGYTQIGWDNPPMKPLKITSFEVQHSTDRGSTWTQIADYTGSHPHEVVFTSPHPRECSLNRYRVRAVYGSDGQSPWKTANLDDKQLRPGYQVPAPTMNYSVAATVSARWVLSTGRRVAADYTLSPVWGNQPNCVSVEVERGSVDGLHAPAPTDSSWRWTDTPRSFTRQFILDVNGNPRLANPDSVAFVVGARVRFFINDNYGPWRYVFWRWGRQTSGNFQVRRALALDFYRDLPDYDPPL